MTMVSAQLEERMRQIEGLVAQIERSTDPAAQTAAREMVGALLELHGAGFARLLENVSEAGACGQEILKTCARDDLVGNMLLLHGLHLEPVQTRVLRAVEKVRPLLQRHEGDVELLEIVEGKVRLHFQGNCEDCPSSLATLKFTVEQAIYEEAPDVAGIEIEGLSEPVRPPTFVRLEIPKELRRAK
jgi:Fe-S cluster biogenesis protein NfuA